MLGAGRAITAVWREFVRNPRFYALFAAGPACLVPMVWVAYVAAEPRWAQPLVQLEILKMAILVLGLTHAIVVIALAAVRVRGTGPAGFSFDVDADDNHESVRAEIEGNVRLTPESQG